MLSFLIWTFSAGPPVEEPVKTLEKRVLALEEKAGFYEKGFWVLSTVLVLEFGGLYGLYSWSKRNTKTKIDEKLDGRLGEIMRLVDADNQEQKLKASPISVVSRTEKFRGLLTDLGFRNARNQELQVAEDHGRDLLVFDGDTLDDSEIKPVVDACADPVFLVYRHGQVFKDDRLTFANSEVTLLARLMEALRYREAKLKST